MSARPESPWILSSPGEKGNALGGVPYEPRMQEAGCFLRAAAGSGWASDPPANTRPRPDDGYAPRTILYETGMPVGKWVYKKS